MTLFVDLRMYSSLLLITTSESCYSCITLDCLACIFSSIFIHIQHLYCSCWLTDLAWNFMHALPNITWLPSWFLLYYTQILAKVLFILHIACKCLKDCKLTASIYSGPKIWDTENLGHWKLETPEIRSFWRNKMPNIYIYIYNGILGILMSLGIANLEKRSIFIGIVDHTAHVLYRLEIWPNREITLKQIIKFI